MASSQFKLSIVPKNAIIQQIGVVPEKLYVLSKNKWIMTCWKIATIQADDIILQIDQLLPQIHFAATHIGWKMQSGALDNDVWMLIEEETRQIKLLDFRANVGEQGLAFIEKMVSIAGQYDCLLIDRENNVIEPKMEAVLEQVKISHPYVHT